MRDAEGGRRVRVAQICSGYEAPDEWETVPRGDCGRGDVGPLSRIRRGA